METGKVFKERDIRNLTGDTQEHQHHSSQWHYKVIMKDSTIFYTIPHRMSEGWRGGAVVHGRSIGQWIDHRGYPIRDIRQITKIHRVWGDGLGDVRGETPPYDKTEEEEIFRSGRDGIIPDRKIASLEHIQGNDPERWKRLVRRSIDRIRKDPELALRVVNDLVLSNQIKTD